MADKQKTVNFGPGYSFTRSHQNLLDSRGVITDFVDQGVTDGELNNLANIGFADLHGVPRVETTIKAMADGRGRRVTRYGFRRGSSGHPSGFDSQFSVGSGTVPWHFLGTGGDGTPIGPQTVNIPSTLITFRWTQSLTTSPFTISSIPNVNTLNDHLLTGIPGVTPSFPIGSLKFEGFDGGYRSGSPETWIVTAVATYQAFHAWDTRGTASKRLLHWETSSFRSGAATTIQLHELTGWTP